MTHSETPYAPAEWDHLLNTTDSPQDLRDLLAGAPAHVRARREVQLAMTTRKTEDVTHALGELSAYNIEAVTGMRLMANIVLGGYPEILATTDPPLLSLDPYAVEDACDAAFARGMALAESHLFHDAFGQFLLAQKLATALGMHYRAQHIEIEWGRVLTNAGRPNPTHIIDAMARLPMSSRRRTWALRCLAEAYIALGDYASARLHQQPLPELSDLGHFLAALQGHDEERARCPQGTYTAVTAALWALRHQEPLSLPIQTSSSPQGDYRDLLRAWAQLRTISMADQAHHTLSSLTVRTPDQQAHRAAALIYANAQGPHRDDIDLLVREFNTALNAMSGRSQFLALLRDIQPKVFVLLGMLPGIHPDVSSGLPEIAILSGQNLTYRYQQYKLPGRASGSALLVQDAVKPRPDTRPHPMIALRIRHTLEGIGVTQYVNIGEIVRSLQTFREGARLPRQEAWATAVLHALDWIDIPTLRALVIADLAL